LGGGGKREKEDDGSCRDGRHLSGDLRKSPWREIANDNLFMGLAIVSKLAGAKGEVRKPVIIVQIPW